MKPLYRNLVMLNTNNSVTKGKEQQKLTGCRIVIFKLGKTVLPLPTPGAIPPLLHYAFMAQGQLYRLPLLLHLLYSLSYISIHFLAPHASP
jgi:hypothetical protein